MTEELNIVKLRVGDKAPLFVSKNQNNEEISLQKILDQGQYVMLVFYPADMTPGCTKQLCGIQDVYHELKGAGITVLGVNKANGKSHQKFIQEYGHTFDILVDEGNVIRDMYGAIKKYFANYITKRGVVLINPEGYVEYTFWGQQDNQKVLDIIKKSQ